MEHKKSMKEMKEAEKFHSSYRDDAIEVRLCRIF